eukprot:scaffold15703_cov36-Tisochrysis_lutea.AAC.2
MPRRRERLCAVSRSESVDAARRDPLSTSRVATLPAQPTSAELRASEARSGSAHMGNNMGTVE